MRKYLSRSAVSLLFILVISLPFLKESRADEGMWLPDQLAKQVKAMRKLGLTLQAADLYSTSKPSIKDAIVQFGGGCTGVLVSPDGLLLTNHHCGYSSIQALSSVDKDYLQHGYGNREQREELPCPGLSVSILEYMQDVTQDILKGMTAEEEADEQKRSRAIFANVRDRIKALQDNDSTLTYEITPLFHGNRYYLFAYRVFHDVRLVFAPPTCLGAFGGDTDNWIYPRHSSDFSLFRVYVDEHNRPAPYSAQNRPYVPKRYVKISKAGVKTGDFAMVYGFPGRTNRFLVSQGVEGVMDRSNPRKVALRDERLRVMNAFMAESDTVRIQYASKYQGVANAWKKWQGEALGLRRLDVPRLRREDEVKFQDWVNTGGAARREKYGNLLQQFESLYAGLVPLEEQDDYFRQGLLGIESLLFARRVASMVNGSVLSKQQGIKLPESVVRRLRELSSEYYKDYSPRVDRGLASAMLTAYIKGLPESARLSPVRRSVKNQQDIERFTQITMPSSLLTSPARFNAWLDRGAVVDELFKDSLYNFSNAVVDAYQVEVGGRMDSIHELLQPVYRRYVEGLMVREPDRLFSPDANFTLRVAYGKVQGYEAREAVHFTPTTSLDGMVEKVSMGRPDYKIPPRLDTIYRGKNYGRWSVNGSVPACFLASVHTTGGNSGSPVLNAKGELIGLNFDRVWEGTMSDIMFDPDKCRNISVDIRFVLFMIEEYGQRPDLLRALGLGK